MNFYVNQNDFESIYKWYLRLKVFVRDIIFPIQDVLLPKFLEDPELLKSEESNHLFSLYYYDFFEPDSISEEETDEQTEIITERKQLTKNLKRSNPSFYTQMQSAIKNTSFNDLLATYMPERPTLSRLLHSRTNQNHQSKDTQRVLLQYSILIKDDAFIEFIKNVPNRLLEFYEQ